MQSRKTFTYRFAHTLVKPTRMSLSPCLRMQGLRSAITDTSFENLRLYDQTSQRSVQMLRSQQ